MMESNIRENRLIRVLMGVGSAILPFVAGLILSLSAFFILLGFEVISYVPFLPLLNFLGIPNNIVAFGIGLLLATLGGATIVAANYLGG